MTGPRIPTVYPHRRRARHLLPFLLAIVASPTACTSDQPTEVSSQPQGQMAAATGSHPRARLSGSRVSTSSMQAAKPRPSTSFAVASTTSSTAQSVLILADTDGPSTNALADTLTSAGFQVTVRPGPEYGWNGTNPVLEGFDVVVHLNGSTYDGNFDVAAQQTLSSFVQNGGGYVGAQWNGAEFTPGMADLILQGVGSTNGTEQNCAVCQVTYETVGGQAGHPVLSGLPTSFTFTADGHDAGEQLVTQGTTVLMRLPNIGPDLGGPAVLVREFGAGKVVNFSFAPNYPFDNDGMPQTPVTLHNEQVKGLYVNAVRWTAGSSAGEPQPQTITFEIADQVYGALPFSAGATASSDLPVSLSATGECTVAGSRVTITAAGACTITAQQAGNADYQPAEDVVRSFNIAKAPAVITVGTEFTYDGSVHLASVTISPAGLTGVAVAYTLAGSPVTQPVNAGVYQVLATLDNQNYEAQPVLGTLTIHPAVPVINWTSPASITAGTPLGATQLNATATGVGGAGITGSFVYLPAQGIVLAVGENQPISVEFIPGSVNYTHAIKTVTITVLAAPVPPSNRLVFKGFFRPVHNLPNVNRVKAGSAIPVRFSVEGARRSGRNRNLNVLKAGSPASVAVACAANATGSPVTETVLAGSSQLRASGDNYTYTWKTSPTWSGTCRKLVVTLVDGSKHEALFRFDGKLKPKPAKNQGAEKQGKGDKQVDQDNHENKAKHGQPEKPRRHSK